MALVEARITSQRRLLNDGERCLRLGDPEHWGIHSREQLELIGYRLLSSDLVYKLWEQELVVNFLH